MKLEDKFNKIIEKLGDYGKSRGIEDYVTDCFLRLLVLMNGRKVIIRGGGIHTEHILNRLQKLSAPEESPIVAVIDDNLQGEQLNGIAILAKKKQKQIKYDMVILSSYSYRHAMREDYESESVLIWDIYEELEKAGYHLEAPFYYYRNKFYETSLYYKHCYQKERTEEMLEMLIDSLLVLKDFHSAFLWIEEYKKRKFSRIALYSEIEEKLKELLEQVRQEMKHSSLQHIIMFWIDAVPYKNLEKLPFMYEKKDKSLFFERVYSSCPNTHPTMHAIMQRTDRIDDYSLTKKEIKKENSIVLQEIAEAGYEFAYMGYVGEKHIDPVYIRIGKEENLYKDDRFSIAACSIYWDTLKFLLQVQKPQFVIMHSICETHRPFISFGMDVDYSYQFKKSLTTGQIIENYKYMNDQLKFYSTLFPEPIIKIYMADHGINVQRDEWNFLEDKMHTFCIIEGEKVKKEKVHKMISYKNFYLILQYILNGDETLLDKALSDYALIEDVDIYNLSRVNKIVAEKNQIYGLAYRCIVTETDKYARLANGKEMYWKLDTEQDDQIDNPLYQERIAQLRELAGDYFLDIKNLPEFKNTRRLYETLEAQSSQKGHVFWVTGLSGAGKTTIGKLLYQHLKKKEKNVVFLDGDIMREVYQTTDYSTQGRLKLAKQHGRLCKMLSDQGIDVVICVIAMYDECRAWNHENISKYHEIYLNVPMEELIRRDQKHLYSKVLKKEISNVMGMDIPFEEPKNPSMVIHNDGKDLPEKIVMQIVEKFGL